METRLEDLRKWFGKGKKGDWVRVGTDGEIKGQCAREPGEGKPKCMPRDKAHSMSKKDRASSARRKRRADPMADRPGTGNKPIMVKTDKKESVEMNEASATNVNKIRAAYKDFMKKKGKNFDDIAMSLSMIANRMTQLARPDSSGRGDYKAEKIIKDEASRIQGIVNKTYSTEEGREIRALLIKHKIYGNGSPGSAIQRLTWESVDMNEATMADRQVFKAMRIAKDMGGNMTGAVRRIEKMKKGLSDHPKVKAALRSANETYKPDPDGGNHKAVKAAQTRAKIAKYNAQARKSNNESVDLEEKNVPTNPALWAKFKAQAKAKFDVYPSAYANGWAAKKYKAAGGGWKTTKENTEMKSFFDIREGREPFVVYDPENGNEVVGTASDEKGAKAIISSAGRPPMSHPNPKALKITKSRKKQFIGRKLVESVELDESPKVGDTALAFQTPYGTVTATKRNTKGMRGKQDGYSLSLKTKSGKTVDLGSHPNPTKANVMSIAKNVMS